MESVAVKVAAWGIMMMFPRKGKQPPIIEYIPAVDDFLAINFSERRITVGRKKLMIADV